MTVSIRTATPADAAALAEVAAATFPLACPPHTTEEAIADFIATHLSAASFADYLADAERVVLIAERTTADAVEPVGYSMLVHGEPADPDVAAAITRRPTVELSKFYTRSEAHGTGVAAELMTATLDAAARRGSDGCWLGVNEENARAVRFYVKSGFAKVGTKRFRVGDRLEDDFVLERPLA